MFSNEKSERKPKKLGRRAIKKIKRTEDLQDKSIRRYRTAAETYLDQVPDAQRHTIASQLYLAKELIYCDLKDGPVTILDEDGKAREYELRNVFNKEGVMCVALIPKEVKEGQSADVKILFRGTYDMETFGNDLSLRGPGSTMMNKHRLELLSAVNTIVGETQGRFPGNKVSMTIAGHSLGGSLAELFTSEIHQAIFYEKHKKDKHPLTKVMIRGRLRKKGVWQGNDDKLRKTSNVMYKQMVQNSNEFKEKEVSFEALANISDVKTSGLCSARVHGAESRTGDGFIALNLDTIQQSFNYCTVEGDIVPLAASRNMGTGLVNCEGVNISFLRKSAGYEAGEFFAAHTHNPLMGQGKNNTQGLTFNYFDNKDESKKPQLMDHLTASNNNARKSQLIYGKLPRILDPTKLILALAKIFKVDIESKLKEKQKEKEKSKDALTHSEPKTGTTIYSPLYVESQHHSEKTGFLAEHEKAAEIDKDNEKNLQITPKG